MSKKVTYQIERNTESSVAKTNYLVYQITEETLFGLPWTKSKSYIASYEDLDKAKKHVDELRKDKVIDY